MKWDKLGRIFNPEDHGLLFAQSPQALVFEDYIRIYFSTRKRDGDKFLSHIAFVDMDKNLKDIKRISTDTVIPLGKLGCFDEHGIFPMNTLRVGDQIYAYTSGWNRKSSVSTDMSIGLAISSDNGLTFKKVGDGPVLTSSLHEPFLVGDAFVRKIKDTFHMWYIFGTTWKVYEGYLEPDRIYKIGHATSNNGIDWVRENKQIISDNLIDESQALPTVIEINDKYHMFFCYRQSSDFRKNSSRGYRIGYAYSYDMISWIRDDEQAGINVTPDSWDSDMMCYPNIFRADDQVYLLYNGNEFGKYGFGIAKLREDT